MLILDCYRRGTYAVLKKALNALPIDEGTRLCEFQNDKFSQNYKILLGEIRGDPSLGETIRFIEFINLILLISSRRSPWFAFTGKQFFIFKSIF